MNASTSLKLFDISLEFIKDKNKASKFVSKLEETIDQKFDSEKRILGTKTDLAEMETKITKTIYIVGLIQFLAIVGSVLAIVTFMLR